MRSSTIKTPAAALAFYAALSGRPAPPLPPPKRRAHTSKKVAPRTLSSDLQCTPARSEGLVPIVAQILSEARGNL